MKKVILKQDYNLREEIPVNHINSRNYFVRVNSKGTPQEIITEAPEKGNTNVLVLHTFSSIRYYMNIEEYLESVLLTGGTIYAFDCYTEAFQSIINRRRRGKKQK